MNYMLFMIVDVVYCQLNYKKC
uniref:Uncharacterized protein n=1 Tax=Heterorhabditis bacteriophora TaxID=37862 RepID=A0A1I7WZ80_HETBA